MLPLEFHTKNMEKVSIDRIDELVRQKLEGKSYTKIRAELNESGMSSEEIDTLIRKVDEKVLQEAVKAGTPNKAVQWHRAGLVLAVLGLLLTIAFNLGFILKSFPAVVVYTPFIAGILLMFYGRMMQRPQPEKKKEGTGAIRKKRPYK